MDREKIDNWLEKSILGVVLGILVYGPLAMGAVRPVDFLIVEGLAGVAGVLWLARLWLAPQHRLLWPPVCWAVLAFVGYAVFSYWRADLEYVARDELARVLVYAFVFLVVINNLNRQESTQIITCTLVFLGMSIALYAVYQFMTGSDKVWNFIKPYPGRGSGTYICPNHLAGFLEMILPLSLAYTLTGRINHVLRVFLGYAGAVMLVGIGVSISRGGWIATVFALIVFAALLMRNPSFRLPVLAASVLFLGVFAFGIFRSDTISKRIARSLDAGQPHYLLGRVPLWQAATRMWQDHVWLGVGPGHFDYRFRAYRPVDQQVRPLRVHNDYLNTLTDWGVAGAVIVTTAFVLLFIGVARTWKFVQRSNDISSRTSNRSAFVLGALVGLTAILFHSAFDFNMHIPANAILAVTLMAMLAGHARFATEKHWLTPGIPLRLAVTVVGLLGLVWLGRQGVARAGELAALKRADQAENRFETQQQELAKAIGAEAYHPAKVEKLTELTRQASDDRVAALKQAHEREPSNFETIHALGEAFYAAGAGDVMDQTQAYKTAIQWYERAGKVNPYDPYNPLRIGICLDQMKDRSAATPYFQHALELDPNGYFTLAYQGWHQVQLGDYAAAKPYLERSLKYKIHNGPNANPLAYNLLGFVNHQLAQAAAKAAKR